MADTQSPAQPVRFPGVGPNERRLYIVNHQVDGINVYSGIDKSPDAIVDQDWAQALPKFIASHPGNPFTGAEIHCHGKSGFLALGADPNGRVGNVDIRNVKQFGSYLRALLKPGSLIELLACKVVSFPVDHILQANAKASERMINPNVLGKNEFYIPGDKLHRLTDQYGLTHKDGVRWTWAEHLQMAKVENRALAEDQVEGRALRLLLGSDLRESIALLTFIDRKASRSLTYEPDAKRRAVPPKVALKTLFGVAEKLSGKVFDADKNGPGFCRALAEASGCIVRAAWISQEQERDYGTETHLIGDWESFVFDFDATGVKQVYYYLGRPQANAPTWDRAAIGKSFDSWLG